MKQLFLIMLSIIGAGTIKAQKDTLGSFTVKRGIYTTFRDLRNNEPLPDKNFKIIKRRNGSMAFTGGGLYGFEVDSLTKNEFSNLKKMLVGVSDGQDFYISDRFTLGGWMGLTKCSMKGPYIFADIEGTAAQYTGGGLIPALIKTGNGYVININKGLSLPLTKKFLKDLLSQYPDLENEYKKKMSFMDHALEIIQRVNEREILHGKAEKQ